MIPLDRFVLLYTHESPGRGHDAGKTVHSAVRLSQIEAFVEAFNVPDRIILTSCTYPDNQCDIASQNPEAAVLGWARLVAFGWPGRKSPILEMWDLEWIGKQTVWPEPEGSEQDSTSKPFGDAEQTLEDVICALGSEVLHEGPRLAAMRIRSERNEAIKESSKMREMIRAVANASKLIISQTPQFVDEADILNKLVERVRTAERQLHAAYGISAHFTREAASSYVKAVETAIANGKEREGESLDEFIQRLANDLKAARARLAEFDTQAGMIFTPDFNYPIRVTFHPVGPCLPQRQKGL